MCEDRCTKSEPSRWYYVNVIDFGRYGLALLGSTVEVKKKKRLKIFKFQQTICPFCGLDGGYHVLKEHLECHYVPKLNDDDPPNGKLIREVNFKVNDCPVRDYRAMPSRDECIKAYKKVCLY